MTFQPTIYVEVKESGAGEYLVAHRDVRDAAHLGEPVVVGIYQLVETKTVTTQVEVT